MWTSMNDVDRMFTAMDLLQNRMNRLVSGWDRYRAYPAVWDADTIGSALRTNLYESDDHLEMKAEVPGMSRNDLSIRVQGNYLEISGSRASDAPEGYSAHRVERGTSSFTRSFTLPAEVDADKIEARLAHGILTLRLPKLETAKPKQITIH